jgi:hypothetical protein
MQTDQLRIIGYRKSLDLLVSCKCGIVCRCTGVYICSVKQFPVRAQVIRKNVIVCFLVDIIYVRLSTGYLICSYIIIASEVGTYSDKNCSAVCPVDVLFYCLPLKLYPRQF